MKNRPCKNIFPSECDEAPELERRRVIDQDAAFTAAMQASGRMMTGPSRAPGTERTQFVSRPATHASAKGWQLP
jgi:hypothetical protein